MHFLEKVINFLENNLPGCLRLGGGGGSKSYVRQFMLAKIIHFMAKIAVRLCAPAQIGLVWKPLPRTPLDYFDQFYIIRRSNLDRDRGPKSRKKTKNVLFSQPYSHFGK